VHTQATRGGIRRRRQARAGPEGASQGGTWHRERQVSTPGCRAHYRQPERRSRTAQTVPPGGSLAAEVVGGGPGESRGAIHRLRRGTDVAGVEPCATTQLGRGGGRPPRVLADPPERTSRRLDHVPHRVAPGRRPRGAEEIRRRRAAAAARLPGNESAA